MNGALFVLGPQRPHPNLPEALARIGGSGPVLSITAGWRLDEAEHEALHAAIGPEAVNLPIYAWFEECMERMPAVRERYRRRQQELIRLKRAYRTRVQHALGAVRALEKAGDSSVVEQQRRFAMEDLRRVDEQFCTQSREVFESFEGISRPWGDPVVGALRRKSASMLSSARAVVVAGGHAAVLRNRLMFFGIHQQLRQAWNQQTAVIGWGAGAMLLTEQIVLYYDDPPDGPQDPEIFDSGLGFVDKAVFLPSARLRLRLEDQERVSIFARRFRGSKCIGLENGAFLEVKEGGLVQHGTPGSAFELRPDGLLHPLEVQP